MKNKLIIIPVIAFIGWFVYGFFHSWSGITGAPFDWTDTAIILLPLAALVVIIAAIMRRKPETTGIISIRLASFYISAIAILFWVISPMEDFLLLSISGRDLAVNIFFYLWEAVILGGAAVIVFMNWFKPVGEFLRRYQSDVKSIDKGKIIEISRLVSRFPLLTASVAAVINAGGYVIGALGFVFFRPDIDLSIVINNLMVGVAVGQVLFVVFYFFTRNILEDVSEVLYVFGDVTSPQRVVGITSKILLPGVSSMVFLAATTIAPIIGLVSASPDAVFSYTVILINFVLAIIIMILTGVAVSADLNGSVGEIKHGIELVQSGNWLHRINIKTGDEMEDVAYSFNKAMAAVEKEDKQ